MGGEVLELWPDRAERMKREARAEGIEQGREQGIAAFASKLRESGVDESLLETAVAAARRQIMQD